MKRFLKNLREIYLEVGEFVLKVAAFYGTLGYVFGLPGFLTARYSYWWLALFLWTIPSAIAFWDPYIARDPNLPPPRAR